MPSLLPSDSSLVFTWSFSPKFICTLIFQRLFHACLQGCSMTQQGFFTPCPVASSLMNCRSFKGVVSGAHRVNGHLLVVLSLSLCVPSDPVFCPPTDDITFRLHLSPTAPLLLSLPSSVLDLNIVYPLRCTDVFLPLPSLLYWLVFCLTLSPSLVYIHPLLLFPIWCWETHLSKSQFPDSEWVPH